MSRPLKIAVAALLAVMASAGAANGAGAATQRFISFSPPSVRAASTHELLLRARRAWVPGSGLRQGELTPLLRELATRLPGLRGSERRQAQTLLARPTDGNADPQQSGYATQEATPACSAHYCVHWVTSGADAPDLTDADGNGIPDYVDSVLATAENVHAVENDQLGWRPPKSDGTLGGDVDKTDIYLKQLAGGGIYGYSAPDANQPQITKTDHSQYAYLVIDNDFQKSEFPSYASPLTPLQVTLAHEYNHVLQFNYDVAQDTWMLEATAVWMEGKVYPAAFDYLQYLPGWVQLTALPITSFNGINANDRSNVKVYGSAVWNKWLDAQFGAAVVRGAWEGSLSTSPQSFAVAAYDSAIRRAGGGGFQTQFDRFAAATAEWQAQNSGFPEGSAYPDVTRAGTLRVDGAGARLHLNHTTYALADVPPIGASRIKLGILAPAGTAAAVALVARTGVSPGGNVTIALRELPKGGIGSVTLDNPSQFTRITAVLVNSDATIHGSTPQTGDWIYAKDNQPYYGRASTDFTAPRVVRVSPSSGARGVSTRVRVKVTFSEPVLGIDTQSLELLAPGGQRVGARVVFDTRGSSVATLVPSRPLGSRQLYRVRVRSTVTDLAVNRLGGTATSRFRTK
jgi:hypothetical protein